MKNRKIAAKRKGEKQHTFDQWKKHQVAKADADLTALHGHISFIHENEISELKQKSDDEKAALQAIIDAQKHTLSGYKGMFKMIITNSLEQASLFSAFSFRAQKELDLSEEEMKALIEPFENSADDTGLILFNKLIDRSLKYRNTGSTSIDG